MAENSNTLKIFREIDSNPEDIFLLRLSCISFDLKKKFLVPFDDFFKGKLFDCVCSRCQAPWDTENAIKCLKCKTGNISPKKVSNFLKNVMSLGRELRWLLGFSDKVQFRKLNRLQKCTYHNLFSKISD